MPVAPSPHHGDATRRMPAEWQDFWALTKPRVMSLAIFTALVGMVVAPVAIPPALGVAAIVAIALGAGASGALNQWYEVDVDAAMRRTATRPLPGGRMEKVSALHFGVGLGVFSVLLLGFATNWLAAAVLATSILFYLIIYTIWLKPRTAQNIVIGGAAGAFPPLIGWAAATGSIGWDGAIPSLPWMLFALIFLWTPPHFWALSLFVRTDYAAANIPMLPVVAGERSTRRHIFVYTLPMIACAMAIPALGQAGALFAWVAGVMSAIFLVLAVHVGFRQEVAGDRMRPEKRLFYFSILYLFLLFLTLMAEKLAQ
ncbi:MAG: protoheme IX farnesyltransferase [Sphingomonadaceae bacterium]|nr:protoheme IX farnesyltransferase [Sphingomonadaceae bacterium]